MITLTEFLMGRDKEFPLTLAQALNAAVTLASVNYLRGRYGKPLSVSSGYRPGRFNKLANGAKNSTHLTCEAIDVSDPFGEFAKWCLDNLKELEKAGVYMENPEKTKTNDKGGWVHLQTRRTRSGQRVFNP